MQRYPMLLDFRLTVWYNGLKATQYFSKFTQESIKVLKDDLTDLGLPHPRRENISLLSHGVVECFWPSAEKNHVLHKNLVAKSKPTIEFKQKIDELSILDVGLKESIASRSLPDSGRPSSLKRPFEPRIQLSAPANRFPDTSRSQQSTARSGHHRTHPSDPSTSSYPADDYPRPIKVAKTHPQGFQLSARSVGHGHDRDRDHAYRSNAIEARHRPQHPASSTAPVMNRSQYLSRQSHPQYTPKYPSDVNIDRRRSSLTQNSPIKVKEEVVDEFLNNLHLSSTIPSQEPSRELPKLKTAEVSSNDISSVHKVRYPPNNNLATSDVRSESQGHIVSKDSLDKDDRIPGLSISERRTVNVVAKAPVQLPTPPTSAPSPTFSMRPKSQLIASSAPVAPLRDPTFHAPLGPSSIQRISATQGNTYPLVPRTAASAAAKRPTAPPIHPAAMNPPTQRSVEDSTSVSRGIGLRPKEYIWRKPDVQSKNDSADRIKALELERIMKELDAVKKELEQERKSRRADEKLLETERKRREEAENALADVRRECRQPFVVPSLLDTFVELSKLTTRGLTVSGSTVVANPASASSYPSLDRSEDVTRTVGHGQSLAAVHDSFHVRTEVKCEPLDILL